MFGRPGPSRAESHDVKMVLVVRGELRLTPGKAAAQVAHAAVDLAREAERRSPDLFHAWLRAGQPKIVLVAATLDEMRGLERRARARGVPSHWIEDAGRTEVPAGTVTCLGLGPAPSDTLDPITGKLDLL